MKTRLTERDLSRIVRRVINEQKNDEIIDIQKALNKVWTNVKIKEDGILGPETEKYIKLFQKQNGLDETGKINDKLKNKLLPLLSNQPKGKNDKDELIKSLQNSLSRMSSDKIYDATMVAQIIYNNCALWMNKESYFSDRPGEPLKNRAGFAPKN